MTTLLVTEISLSPDGITGKDFSHVSFSQITVYFLKNTLKVVNSKQQLGYTSHVHTTALYRSFKGKIRLNMSYNKILYIENVSFAHLQSNFCAKLDETLNQTLHCLLCQTCMSESVNVVTGVYKKYISLK